LKYFLLTSEYGALKPVAVILRRGRRKMEGDEPNQGTLYTYGNVIMKPLV
jgi:hypothetical protein